MCWMHAVEYQRRVRVAIAWPTLASQTASDSPSTFTYQITSLKTTICWWSFIQSQCILYHKLHVSCTFFCIIITDTQHQKTATLREVFPLRAPKLDPLPCLRKSHRIALTGVYKLSSISCQEKCHDFDVTINAEVLPASGSMWQPLCYNKPRFPSYVRYKPSPSRQTIVSGSHVPRVMNEIDKMDHFNFWNIFTIPCASVMKNGWYTNYWQQLN